MSEFETNLHSQVDQSRRYLEVASRAGHEYEAHLHGARIRDLLEMAGRHGVDTSDWVDPELLDAVTLGN
jgi:hypothetical protein